MISDAPDARTKYGTKRQARGSDPSPDPGPASFRDPDTLRAGGDPSPLPWMATALVTAYLVGSLFRAHTDTGIGFYRMFGTIGIVIIGILGSRALYASFTGEARRQLRGELARLPEDFLIIPGAQLAPPGGDKGVLVEYLIVGPQAVHLLAVDETARHAFKSSYESRIHRTASRLWRAYRLTHKLLAANGIENITVQPGIISLLRHEPREEAGVTAPGGLNRSVPAAGSPGHGSPGHGGTGTGDAPAGDVSRLHFDGIPIFPAGYVGLHLEAADGASDPRTSVKERFPSGEEQKRLKGLFQSVVK